MTKDDINTAIAKALGDDSPHWRCRDCGMDVPPEDVTFYEYHDGCGGRCDFVGTKDYAGDLNLIREAEDRLFGGALIEALYRDAVNRLTMDAGQAYRSWLASVCGGSLEAMTASAVQRAEAFLRTAGSWNG